MNLKLSFLVSISTILILTGCGSGKNENQNLNIDNSSSSNSINKLNAEMSPKIIGLWKVFKVETKDGKNKIASENYYLNLKEDNTYETNEDKGNWSLSYGIINGELQTLLTILPSHQSESYSDDAKIRKASISIENQTTYLKLTDLYNYRTRTLVHQN